MQQLLLYLESTLIWVLHVNLIFAKPAFFLKDANFACCQNEILVVSKWILTWPCVSKVAAALAKYFNFQSSGEEMHDDRWCAVYKVWQFLTSCCHWIWQFSSTKLACTVFQNHSKIIIWQLYQEDILRFFFPTLWHEGQRRGNVWL